MVQNANLTAYFSGGGSVGGGSVKPHEASAAVTMTIMTTHLLHFQSGLTGHLKRIYKKKSATVLMINMIRNMILLSCHVHHEDAHRDDDDEHDEEHDDANADADDEHDDDDDDDDDEYDDDEYDDDDDDDADEHHHFHHHVHHDHLIIIMTHPQHHQQSS